MTALTRFLDEIDQRRSVAAPEKLRCPCCGDHLDRDEFDEAGFLFQAEHLAELRAHFGGLVCNGCADSHGTCHGCGNVSGDARVKFGGLCDDCDAHMNPGHRPMPGDEW